MHIFIAVIFLIVFSIHATAQTCPPNLNLNLTSCEQDPQCAKKIARFHYIHINNATKKEETVHAVGIETPWECLKEIFNSSEFRGSILPGATTYKRVSPHGPKMFAIRGEFVYFHDYGIWGAYRSGVIDSVGVTEPTKKGNEAKRLNIHSHAIHITSMVWIGIQFCLLILDLWGMTRIATVAEGLSSDEMYRHIPNFMGFCIFSCIINQTASAIIFFPAIHDVFVKHVSIAFALIFTYQTCLMFSLFLLWQIPGKSQSDKQQTKNFYSLVMIQIPFVVSLMIHAGLIVLFEIMPPDANTMLLYATGGWNLFYVIWSLTFILYFQTTNSHTMFWLSDTHLQKIYFFGTVFVLACSAAQSTMCVTTRDEFHGVFFLVSALFMSACHVIIHMTFSHAQDAIHANTPTVAPPATQDPSNEGAPPIQSQLEGGGVLTSPKTDDEMKENLFGEGDNNKEVESEDSIHEFPEEPYVPKTRESDVF